MKKIIPFVYIGILFVLTPLGVLAHGFGERIDLPIPLNLYLIGAGAAVLISFILIGLINHKGGHIDSYPRYNLLKIRWIRALIENSLLLGFLKAFFVFLLLLIIVAGFAGRQNSAFNIAPTFVWILFGVGMTYFSAFIGNIWSLINPWKNIFSWIERIFVGFSLKKKWPKFWGVWPAVVLFFIYRWVENVYPNSAEPNSLAALIVLYSLITFAGMFYFGKENWLRFGDPFSVFFRFLARFSITEMRVIEGKKELNIRPPAVGLFKEEGLGASGMVFVLFMLSSVAFDGVIATSAWQSVYFLLLNLGLGAIFAKTLGLLALLLIFLVIYTIFSMLARFFSQSKESISALAYKFVYALLPIAIVYEVAHFVTLLFLEGQRAIYLVSNPFGFGWNIFGSADYKIDFQVINLKTLWNWQVALIILGHIAAVYIAHIIAIHFFKDKKKALKSQYPMLVLMVFYTIFSLWIIAQPILLAVE